MVLPQKSKFKKAVLREFHNTPSGGHSGIFRTYKRVAANFFWVGMKKDVQDYVQRCDVCQRHKHDMLTPAGLLQPLPIPDHVWEDVSMDFIDGLLSSNGFFMIFMVVNHLSKYDHFIAMKQPHSAKGVAKIFIQEVVHLHGMPQSIVSNKDPVFIS